MCIGLRNRESGQNPTEGSRAIEEDRNLATLSEDCNQAMISYEYDRLRKLGVFCGDL
jgi:hypothetical protein